MRQLLRDIVGHDRVDRVVDRNDAKHFPGVVDDRDGEQIVLAIVDATSTAGASGATVTKSVSMMRSMKAVGSASSSARNESAPSRRSSLIERRRGSR